MLCKYNYSLHTVGVKTVISLPDDIFERATAHAQSIGISRSELFVTALRQYFDLHDQAALLSDINQACGNIAAGNEMSSIVKSNLLKVQWDD